MLLSCMLNSNINIHVHIYLVQEKLKVKPKWTAHVNHEWVKDLVIKKRGSVGSDINNGR